MPIDTRTGTFTLRRRPPYIGFTDAFVRKMREDVERHRRVYDLATVLFWTTALLFAAYDVASSLVLAELGATEQNPLFRAVIAAAGGYWVLAPLKAGILGGAYLLWRYLPVGAEIGVPIGMTAGTLLPIVINTQLLLYLS